MSMPIPLAERSILPRFGKAVRYKPPRFEATHDSSAPVRLRDSEAAVFGNHPTHVLWSHLSLPDGDYSPCERRHLAEPRVDAHESKRRSRHLCEPLPQEYLRERLLPLRGSGGGLAEPRPEVTRLAERFSTSPVGGIATVGEDPRNFAPRNVKEQNPLQRASSNPLVISDSSPSVKVIMGKRPLSLPRETSLEIAPTFCASPTFAKYSLEERRGGKKFGSPFRDGGASYDPLELKASNGGRQLEAMSPEHRKLTFAQQQHELSKKLGVALSGLSV